MSTTRSCVISSRLMTYPHFTLVSLPETLPVHYENTPLQYTVVFNGYKNDNFQMKNCDIFHISAQYIDCGYTLEPPH